MVASSILYPLPFSWSTHSYYTFLGFHYLLNLSGWAYRHVQRGVPNLLCTLTLRFDQNGCSIGWKERVAAVKHPYDCIQQTGKNPQSILLPSSHKQLKLDWCVRKSFFRTLPFSQLTITTLQLKAAHAPLHIFLDPIILWLWAFEWMRVCNSHSQVTKGCCTHWWGFY